jgi:transcriptional regulator with XRE-family HTH domain
MFINIEVERLRHYMSRKSLATALSITINTLNDWVYRREAIPAEQLRALSRLFGCSVDYLLKERG